MTVRFPRHWASTYNMTRDRVDIDEARAFVSHVQSLEFGEMLELNAHEEEMREMHSEAFDNQMETERALQAAFDEVISWLDTLDADGQQTISTRKVITRIEDETGYEFEYTE